GGLTSAARLADGHGYYLSVERAALPRRGRALVALGRETVLVGAADVALGRDVLRRLAHMAVLEGAPQAVVDHGIDRLLVAVLPTRASAEEQVRGAAHALLPAGDDEVGVAGADRLGRQHHCLEAAAAHLVDRHRGDAVG